MLRPLIRFTLDADAGSDVLPKLLFSSTQLYHNPATTKGSPIPGKKKKQTIVSYVELEERVDLSLQHRHAFQQLLSGHGPHHALGPVGIVTEPSSVTDSRERARRWERCSIHSPFLHSGEIESHLTVGEGLLVQVPAVPSDERRHVVAWMEDI